jgi:hypothetical protein
MIYEKHESLINLLFAELQRDPPDRFKKPTMSQLASADREVHVKLAEKTRAGLPLGPGGELPLDQHLDTVLSLPSIMWLLMPKPKTTTSEKSNSHVEKSTALSEAAVV